MRCLCNHAGGVRVLHVHYSHAAAGTFGSHRSQAPAIIHRLIQMHIYIYENEIGFILLNEFKNLIH